MSKQLEKFVKDLEIAEEILKNINIPTKKDSMLASAKAKHVTSVGELLKNILDDYEDIKYKEVIVERFTQAYSDHVLKFIKGE